jgi:hydroxymethylpyrimidine/phosphomethylpyrimidine kinase
VVKGGHLSTEPIDVYFDGNAFEELRAERLQTPHTHGTGCTFSSAIAGFLAGGLSVSDAVLGAKRYVTEAIRYAPGLGHGHGPVDHFWPWRQMEQESSLPQKSADQKPENRTQRLSLWFLHSA